MSTAWIITGILVAAPVIWAVLEIARDFREWRKRERIQRERRGDGMP